MMKRTIFLTCCIILSMLFMPGMAFAAGNGFEELEYGDGQKLYVLLPSDFDPGQEYPSVWFMPPDGTEPQQYLDDGIDQVIRKLEDEGNGMLSGRVLTGGMRTLPPVWKGIRTMEGMRGM